MHDAARGGFEQMHRRPPPAAETGSRSRGRGRRGPAPPKGRRSMRAPQPVQCPPPAFRRAKIVLRTVFKARLGESPGRTKKGRCIAVQRPFFGRALAFIKQRKNATTAEQEMTRL